MRGMWESVHPEVLGGARTVPVNACQATVGWERVFGSFEINNLREEKFG